MKRGKRERGRRSWIVVPFLLVRFLWACKENEQINRTKFHSVVIIRLLFTLPILTPCDFSRSLVPPRGTEMSTL